MMNEPPLGEDIVQQDDNNNETTTTTTTIIEVNFRLDPNGRTIPPAIVSSSHNDDDHNNNGAASTIGGIMSKQQQQQLLPIKLNYSTRAIATHFERINYNPIDCKDDRIKPDPTTIQSNSKIENDMNIVLDDLLLDCDIADSCLMPRTFWIDSTMKPRCNLEQMAYNILQYYCPSPFESSRNNNHTNNNTTILCGAEWWVQIRPSPDGISRYTAKSYTDKVKVNDGTNTTNDVKDNHPQDNTCN
jgi:hypothetical protein